VPNWNNQSGKLEIPKPLFNAINQGKQETCDAGDVPVMVGTVPHLPKNVGMNFLHSLLLFRVFLVFDLPLIRIEINRERIIWRIAHGCHCP